MVCDCQQDVDSTADDVRSTQLAQRLLQQHGRQLTYNVVHASVFQLPSHTLGKVADLLANLVAALKQVATQSSECQKQVSLAARLVACDLMSGFWYIVKGMGVPIHSRYGVRGGCVPPEKILEVLPWK